MRALVTGGTGFVGSHLVNALLERGDQVRCLVRRTSNLRWLQGLDIETVLGDCCDRESLGAAVKGVNRVFHVAGMTRAARKADFARVNAVGTANLVDAAIADNGRVEKFVYVSSQAAAGPNLNGERRTEQCPPQPVSAYGRSKLAGENAVLARKDLLPVTILRPSAVYGPRDSDFLFFYTMLDRRVKPILGTGDQRVSLCYVTDLVGAILQASENVKSTGEAFFVSDGHQYQVKDIVDIMARTMDVHAVRLRVPRPMLWMAGFVCEAAAALTGRPAMLTIGKAREILQRDWTCDITRARNVLGYQPAVGLSEGVRLTCQWYRRNDWL